MLPGPGTVAELGDLATRECLILAEIGYKEWVIRHKQKKLTVSVHHD